MLQVILELSQSLNCATGHPWAEPISNPTTGHPWADPIPKPYYSSSFNRTNLQTVLQVILGSELPSADCRMFPDLLKMQFSTKIEISSTLMNYIQPRSYTLSLFFPWFPDERKWNVRPSWQGIPLKYMWPSWITVSGSRICHYIYVLNFSLAIYTSLYKFISTRHDTRHL